MKHIQVVSLRSDSTWKSAYGLFSDFNIMFKSEALIGIARNVLNK